MTGRQPVNDLTDVITRLRREHLISGEWKINYSLEDRIHTFLKPVIRKQVPMIICNLLFLYK